MNKVERGWRIGLHVDMNKSNLENAVLDRRRFYEIKFISRTDKNTEHRKTKNLLFENVFRKCRLI